MKVPVPDLDLQKRPRDDFTDKLIKEALEEEQLAKKAKKAQPQREQQLCTIVMLVHCSILSIGQPG
jgi:hypothetical protein